MKTLKLENLVNFFCARLSLSSQNKLIINLMYWYFILGNKLNIYCKLVYCKFVRYQFVKFAKEC